MKQSYFFKSLIVAILSAGSGYAQCTPPAMPTASGPTEPICNGTTATLTATADTGTLAWFNTSLGGIAIGTGPSFTTPALTATTSYWVEAQTTGTGTPQSGGAKVAPTSSSGTTVNTASDPWGLSFDATSDFTLNSVDVFLTSGTAGTVVMYLKDSGYNILETLSIPVPAGGTSSNPVQHTLPLNLFIPAGTGYKLVVESGPAMIRDLGSNAFPYPIGTVGSVTGGTINNSNTNSAVYYFLYNWNFTPGAVCASARQEVVVNVTPAPAAPTASAQAFCGSGTVGGLQATGTALKWYATSTGGTELADDVVLSTANYYVSQTIDGCESTRIAVPVTVTPIPDGPVANAQSFCGGGTVGQLTATGTNLAWYATETANAPLSEGTALETGTYYVSQTINNCEGTRTAVAITINEAPSLPQAPAQAFCGGAVVSQLEAVGENIQWYDTEDSTVPLTGDTALSGGMYYVTQTVGDCESSRIGVTITINPVPDAPMADAQAFCGSGMAGQLVAEGTNLQWFDTETGGAALTDDTGLAEGTYYVSQTVSGCESARTAVAVTINTTPEPMGNALQDFIPGETLADLVVEGEILNWYADEDGTMPLEDSTVLVHGASYWVSQTIDGCEGPLMMVTVNQVMSVQAQAFSGLSYYPNPTYDKLTISNTQPITGIAIYNLQGQRLLMRTANTTDTTVDLSAFAAGAYIVNITSGEATTTVKVVKQ